MFLIVNWCIHTVSMVRKIVYKNWNNSKLILYLVTYFYFVIGFAETMLHLFVKCIIDYP